MSDLTTLLAALAVRLGQPAVIAEIAGGLASSPDGRRWQVPDV